MTRFLVAALIGAGDFGTAIVTQSLYIPRLKFCAVADIDLAAAKSAYHRMGYADHQIAVCNDSDSVRSAMAKDMPVVVTDAGLLMDWSLEITTARQ